MIARDELLQLHAMLSRMHMDDPVLALANAVFWLCPYVERDLEYDMDEPIVYALLVAREQFPAIYFAGMDALHRGMNERAVQQLLLDEYNALVVARLDDLSELPWGVPMHAFGADPGNDEWRDYAEDYALLADALGLEPGYDSGRFRQIANVVMRSLLDGGELDPDREQTLPECIGWLLAYLDNGTGNDLCDWTQESLLEMGVEFPRWTPEDVAFANEVNGQAQQIIGWVERAMAFLKAHRAWREALINNWLRVERSIKRGRKPSRRACQWPAIPEQPDYGDAPAVPRLL